MYEENKGFLADRCVDEFGIPLFRKGNLFLRGIGAEENVRFPFCQQFITTHGIVVFQGAVVQLYPVRIGGIDEG